MSTPVLNQIFRAVGDKVSSSYIVLLNDGVDRDSFVQSLQRTVDSSAFNLVQTYTVVNGFSGTFNDAALAVVQKAPEVKRIEEVSA